jgi:hypothetical protein
VRCGYSECPLAPREPNGVSSGYAAFPQTFVAGTPIVLDSAGSLCSAIGAGNLRTYADTDAVGHATISN